jgi:hypothetical protein
MSAMPPFQFARTTLKGAGVAKRRGAGAVKRGGEGARRRPVNGSN